MRLARRSLLLGALVGVVGCAGDPTVAPPEGAEARIRPSEPPEQEPGAAGAAAALAGVRGLLLRTDAGSWRAAALAQCDEQLARLNSIDRFAEPDPAFSPAAESFADLSAGIAAAVSALVEAADASEAAADRLFFYSAAAATKALENRDSAPGAGTGPSYVDEIEGQRVAALGHAWALIYALEIGVGRLGSEDDERFRERLSSARTLRNELRDGIDGVAPSQPASFAMPTSMDSKESITLAVSELELRLLESLVLLAAEDGDGHWQPQVRTAQDAGAAIPRWPGWD